MIVSKHELRELVLKGWEIENFGNGWRILDCDISNRLIYDLASEGLLTIKELPRSMVAELVKA